jgi:hypothetical protein
VFGVVFGVVLPGAGEVALAAGGVVPGLVLSGVLPGFDCGLVWFGVASGVGVVVVFGLVPGVVVPGVVLSGLVGVAVPGVGAAVPGAGAAVPGVVLWPGEVCDVP